MSGQIFISYRREESRWSARSLHDRLCRDFDPTQIFMDIDAIALGEDFVKAIETTVAKCDVLIAVIGNNWLTSKDDHGDRRLDNPEDFVRMEIGAALKREISVIPVLVDAALMPRAIDLPEDLKSLVRRNALRITDTSFDGDCQRLAATIRLVLEKAAAVEQERPVATLTPPAQPEADKPSAKTPKMVHPLPPKPPEPERVKPPSPSSGGTGGKSSSKRVIAFSVIVAVPVVAGLIYLATRASQSPPPQPVPVAAVTPSPPVIATPLTPQPTTPTSTPSAAESLAQAQRYLDAKDFAKALPRLQKSAEAGDTDAMYKLGWLYGNGKGVAQDYDKAREWYQKAADAGNPVAMNNLGVLYRNGKGVAQDYDKAREWYQKAAEAGNTDAKQALAHLPAEVHLPRRVTVSPPPSTKTTRMSDEEIRAHNEKVFERLGISRMSDEEIRAHNEKVFERLGISPTPASP